MDEDGLPERRPTKPNLFSRAVTFRKASDAQDVRGPLGLSTIHKPLGEVTADIIFVHGLGGGSRKTWTKNDNPDLYWPQEWLPQDPAFQNVRIHMFGYDSNWDKASILNIHDFAKSLLEWVTNCPDIPQDIESPLILVCHSMGGLVAKKAYTLSRQSEEHGKFSAQVRSIFFLATPHRGSNLAELLSRVLQVSSGARPYVNDLQPNSATIQAINEDFPRYCQQLELFSFYETLPMNVGVQKKIVVPKDSATLGYSNERTMYLDANHREVCKFENQQEHNYRAVRNALAEVLQGWKKITGVKRVNTNVEHQQWLNDSLDIEDAPEDDYLRAKAYRLPGSCEWIALRSAFQTWRDEGRPQLYWVTAKPGAGKSVLCGKVLESLRAEGKTCAFYFFTHGDKLESTMGRFFRSMAWQMASTNPAIFGPLSKICKRDPHLSQADYRTIWRKLFLECIFKHPSPRPQYWIVDALDECRTDSELVPYLLQAANAGSIRIFLTSRTSFSSYGLPNNSELSLHVDAVSQATINADIELYLNANTHNLPGRNRDFTQNLLLEKASGCFLWVRLALQELRRASTRGGIQQILNETPSDMDQLYSRILDSTFSRAREKEMVVGILNWVACAARPLATNELYHALRYDMNDEIDDDLKRFLENNCGQLVIVDPSDHVRMVHATARDFLFSDNNVSALKLSRKSAHKKLAMVCLNYLCGSEMAGSKPRKLSTRQVVTKRCAFAAYACESWFEHLRFVSSEDDEFAATLVRFLKSTNLLSWIEYVAKKQDLSKLIQTGHALNKYLLRRTQKTLPFGNAGKENQLFDAWSADFVRLVTKFGANLLASPSSIFSVVAPFCPEESAMRSQYANAPRSIRVSGLSARSWDDCYSTITLPASTSAVACGASVIAVGMHDGSVAIYDQITCQYLRTLKHGEAVKKLLFGDKQPLLVSAGLHKISIWNGWELHWTFELESQLISTALTDEDRLLLATFRSNEMLIWDVATGLERERISWLDEDKENEIYHFRRPVTTAIASDQTLLAIAYRGQDVIVWDIENASVYDVYGKDEGSLGVTGERRTGIASSWSMIFSKAPETKLLVVCYNDGMLSLFNIDDGTVQAKAAANAHTLASSDDGLTLACGNSGGSIQLFEFDTLKLLYKIQAEEMNIKQLAFTADGHRLVDIQDNHCRVWEPPALVRQEIDEENSDTISVSTSPADFKLDEDVDTVHISSVTCSDDGSIIFCGKENGGIYTYDPQTGNQEKELLIHTMHTPVVMLHYDTQSQTLASSDASSRSLVHKLVREAESWKIDCQLLDHRAGVAVTQILANLGCDRLLISTANEDILWQVDVGSCREQGRLRWENERLNYQWTNHPSRRGQLILLVGTKAWIYEWDSLTQLGDAEGIQLQSFEMPNLAIRTVQPCFDDNYLATVYVESGVGRDCGKLIFWEALDITPSSKYIAAVPRFQALADQVLYVVGRHGHRLVFLHRDGWICSADSQSFHEEYYDRHFFIPADWLSASTNLKLDILRNGSIIFVKRDELAIISRGLEHFEHGQSKNVAKRPSISQSVRSIRPTLNFQD
ncbi:hypothetical protein H2202_007369 [Exophiala xenobiotica]|nr:hypothetical protein H2202_007369 [Exophiala xenobiotica]KAK5329753.1 hypothetical protein LTR93_001340 [Exophiala xenobiotica]KAK5416690.1 hypothetical protein LTR06_002675 [Exophiala xenobiotica]